MRRPPVLVMPPDEFPVSLEAVKKHLRVDHSDDDDTIQEALDAAVKKLDGYSGRLGRALVTQTWKISTGNAGCRYRFPIAPIVEIVSIGYQDVAGADQTWPEVEYGLSSDLIGPLVAPANGRLWPATRHGSDGLTITFVAGYGGPEDVPSDIRLAIKLDVEMAYDRPDGERFKALQAQYEAIVRRNRRGNV